MQFCRETTGCREITGLQGNYVCQQNYESDKITSLGGNYMWEEITGCREIPKSGEMHEWEEITEPGKVQEWERFPSAGKLQSAAKLQFREEFAKVRKTTKSSWSICGTIDSRPQSRTDAMMQGTDGSTLEKSEVRALMRSIV
jgi:hypothetical protein